MFCSPFSKPVAYASAAKSRVFDRRGRGIPVAEFGNVNLNPVVTLVRIVGDARAKIGDLLGQRAGDHARKRAGRIPVNDAEVDVVPGGLKDCCIVRAVRLRIKPVADFDVGIDLLHQRCELNEILPVSRRRKGRIHVAPDVAVRVPFVIRCVQIVFPLIAIVAIAADLVADFPVPDVFRLRMIDRQKRISRIVIAGGGRPLLVFGRRGSTQSCPISRRVPIHPRRIVPKIYVRIGSVNSRLRIRIRNFRRRLLRRAPIVSVVFEP